MGELANAGILSENDLMYVIGGQLFYQAPNCKPRNVETIMEKVKSAFREKASNFNEFYSLEISKSDIPKYVEDLLMGIPEFVDLNLSQEEIDKNILVDDEKRPKYAFITGFDKQDSESWKKDFIDLEAFIRNVSRKLSSFKY